MATGATLQQVIADCKLYDPNWEDLALVVKRALFNAHVDGSGNCIIPISAAGQNGATVTMAVDAAVKFYQFCLKMDSGGLVAQPVEFNTPNRFPGLMQ